MAGPGGQHRQAKIRPLYAAPGSPETIISGPGRKGKEHAASDTASLAARVLDDAVGGRLRLTGAVVARSAMAIATDCEVGRPERGDGASCVFGVWRPIGIERSWLSLPRRLVRDTWRPKARTPGVIRRSGGRDSSMSHRRGLWRHVGAGETRRPRGGAQARDWVR